MSTRSLIGIINDDDSVNTIYCHWDGYPKGVGDMLIQNYTEPEKIRQLLELGDISSLEPNITPEPDTQHSFEAPQNGVVIAYHRDRGESKHPFYTWKTKHDIPLSARNNWGAEYVYIFDHRKWLFADLHQKGHTTWQDLAKHLGY